MDIGENLGCVYKLSVNWEASARLLLAEILNLSSDVKRVCVANRSFLDFLIFYFFLKLVSKNTLK